MASVTIPTPTPLPTTHHHRWWIAAAILTAGAGVAVALAIPHTPTTPQSPPDTYLAALLATPQTNRDPLYALAQQSPRQAINLGQATCTVMRADRASHPSLYSDARMLLDDVKHQLGADWDSALRDSDGTLYDWDYATAAAAAAQPGSLCPEFAAELGAGN